MGIIDDGGIALRRMDRFQTTAHTFQCAKDEQHVFGLLAQHHRRTIDGEQIAHIELSNELYAHLLAVDVEIHTLEVALDKLRLEVRHTASGIGLHLSLTVLHHKQTVLIVGIGDGEGIFPETVEEGFLRIAIVLEGAVIVQMVTRQVRKETACEVQSSDTLLGDGVTAALHKGILTAGIHHPSQEFVQLDGIGRRMVCGDGLILDIVADGGEEAALVSELAEHII